MDFYREALGAQGATERTINTVLTDGIFSMIFDGWAPGDGQPVVVQGTPLGPDELNVNIRFEDV